MKSPGLALLDSAHGTRLIARGLDVRSDDPALWVLARPDEIRNLHLADLYAGSETITTCTFGANRHWLKRYPASDASRINRRAVEIARQSVREAGAEATVSGAIGPTALENDKAWREQFDCLIEAGADRIVLETLSFDQIPQLRRLLPGLIGCPVFVTLWNWGEDPAEVARRLADCGVAGWGINCVSEPESIFAVLGNLRDAAKPAEMLKHSTPVIDDFVRVARLAIDYGVSSIGGCCGTDHRHVESLKHALGRCCGPHSSGEGFKALPGTAEPEIPDRAGSGRNQSRREL